VVFAKDQQQHSVADLPVELVNKARAKYHLLAMPLAALSSSQHAASMLSIDFKREVDAKGAHDALRQLQKQYGGFMAISNFRGRLLFPAFPGEDIVDAIAALPAVRSVRRPFVLRDAGGTEDDDTAADQRLPEATSKGPCLLLVGAAFVPPTWAAAVATLINTTVPGSATVTSCDGRSALIAVSAAQLARFKDNASLRLFDLAEAQRLREAAKRDLEVSLARAAAGSRRRNSHTTTPA
jgi:hypothetical protein